jgi:SH3-like domain-containing protein
MANRPLFTLVVAALAALFSPAAAAIDYSSVVAPAILYDSPSGRGQPLFIIRAGTPVEVVLVLNGATPDLPTWVKVRDPSGALSWIEHASLARRRTVLVTAEQATVLRDANAAAPVAFTVTRDVVLDYLGTNADGWVQVRHADGTGGYLRASAVWGL